MTTNKPHISFDLETLGKTGMAPIVQIGACKFNVDGEIDQDHFIRSVDLDSLDKFELHTDYNTIKWWFSQDDAAIKSVFCTDDAVNLRVALMDFKDWIGKTADYYYWSHATFDPPILTQNCKAVGLGTFIPYRLFRDIRTLVHFTGQNDTERAGIHHNALDDAIYQAQYISERMRKLIK